MARDRRQARILAMQALCQWDVQADASDEAFEELFAAMDAPGPVRSYAGVLVRGYLGHREWIDQRMAQASPHWDIGRISPVERNVMRVAMVELSGGDVPPKVAINEAIEIAREFGGVDSPRFVNGVLDEVFRKLKEDIA